MNKIDIEQVQEIADLWNDGMSATNIGKTLDLTRNVVIGLVDRNKYGLFTRKGSMPPTNQKLTMHIDVLRREHKAGMTLRQMAAKYGVSKQAISNKFKVETGATMSGKTVTRKTRVAERRQASAAVTASSDIDTMRWITHAGAEVTLPRVRFLENANV